jgi:Flp pilus assembly protein TadG
MTRPRFLRAIRRPLADDGGVTAMEFAFVGPVLVFGMVGILEVAMVIFIGSSIEAAVIEASRFGITGGANPGVSRQERVLQIVGDRTYGLVDMDEVTIDTLVYESFADIGQPEPFTDLNANAVWDEGEPFTDVNGNGTWDADMGTVGLGGPSDVVVYRVRYAWGIITPMMRAVLGGERAMQSSVAVRNEPF